MIGNSRYRKIIAAVVVAVITGKILLDSRAAKTDITADAGVSQKTIGMVEEAYHLLPPEIRTAIGEHGTGVRILENGDTISSAYGITNLNATKDQNGCFVWDGTADIFINGSQPDSEVKKTVIHEAGHWTDAYVGELLDLSGAPCDKVSDVSSNTVDFKDIYETEKEMSGWNAYVTRAPSEYYAESFYVFLTDPDTLRERQPHTYEYMIEDMERAVGGKYAATEHAQ